MMQLFANEIKKQEVFQMGKLNEWHNMIIPDDDFDSTVLYETICTTLLDENKIEIRRENTKNGVMYRWRIINTCNKIALYGYPGQELKIILTDKMQ
jgi:hypothetical protein